VALERRLYAIEVSWILARSKPINDPLAEIPLFPILSQAHILGLNGGWCQKVKLLLDEAERCLQKGLTHVNDPGLPSDIQRLFREAQKKA
jgi:hypothetical protein